MQPLKFRSPDEAILHVANTKGHAARIGPEWRELPALLHKDAIAAGAITSNMSEEAIVAQAKALAASRNAEFSQEDEVRKAIQQMLEEDAKDNFTGAGKPNLNILSKRAGFGVDRALMEKVWSEMEAEAATPGTSAEVPA